MTQLVCTGLHFLTFFLFLYTWQVTPALRSLGYRRVQGRVTLVAGKITHTHTHKSAWGQVILLPHPAQLSSLHCRLPPHCGFPLPLHYRTSFLLMHLRIHSFLLKSGAERERESEEWTKMRDRETRETVNGEGAGTMTRQLVFSSPYLSFIQPLFTHTHTIPKAAYNEIIDILY